MHTVHISGHAVSSSTLKRQLGWAGSGRTGLPGEGPASATHAARSSGAVKNETLQNSRLVVLVVVIHNSRRSRRRGCGNGGIHQVLAALLFLGAD
jgi:hypothetical protein